MKRLRPCVMALVAAAAAAFAAVGAAEEQPGAIRIAPSLFRGSVHRGERVGPIVASNTTGQSYDMRVFPALLTQSRDGGIGVLDGRRERRRAARLIAVQERRFGFPDGARRSVAARVVAVPPRKGIYAGIVFKATPRRRVQITTILQLAARVLLDPPPRSRRVRWRSDAIRVVQNGRRRLRVLVPVRNRGNVFREVSGVLTIRDAGGRRVVRQPVRLPDQPAKGIEILPGAIVDLPTDVTKLLAPGRYALTARMRGAGRRFTARGTMELFGPNQVRSENARLVEFDPPKAYRGKDVTVRARFQNTGNVTFRPGARLVVRPNLRGEVGEPIVDVRADADRVRPGQEGGLEASVGLPRRPASFELAIRLLVGGHEVDTRTVSVTPQERPSRWQEIQDWITRHAVAIVAVLLLLLLLAAALGVRYVRRLRAAVAPVAEARRRSQR